MPRAVLAALAPVVALFDEAVGSGMSLGAQTARGDVIDSPLQRELDLPLTSVRDYATRVLRAADGARAESILPDGPQLSIR